LRILLISPAFFGYEQEIRVAFERRGAVVDYFDERPSNHSLAKAVLRVKKSLVSQTIRSHFEWIYRSIAGRRYDLVLVIKGEVLPVWFLARLRDDYPDATFTFYSFDTIRNSPNCVELFSLFDRLYSFDFEDVQNHPQLELKHLFYTSEYTGGPPLRNRDYNISFVGTLHSQRYAFVRNVFEHFESTYQHFYVQAPWFYYLSRATNAGFRDVPRGHVSFQKLTRAEVAKVFKRSCAVLDMQREGQCGLTMRTFEALASGATLVTSNSFIKQTELYDPQRVIVIPPGGPEEPTELVQCISSSLSRDGQTPFGLEQYSIDSWVAGFTEKWMPEPAKAANESYR
jgi:hypothetical protein